MSLKEKSELFDLLPSGEEMAEFDRYTIDTQGISSLTLMESAGTLCADYLLKNFPAPASILILCGPGNNGGDGYVIARRLLEEGREVSVIQLSTDSPSNDLSINRTRYEESGGEVTESSDISDTTVVKFKMCSLIVDALLGTGQKMPPRPNVCAIISYLKLILSETDSVVAIDVPTGVNPTTGEVYDGALRANYTLCIEFIKRGLTQAPAVDFCGLTVTLPIGIRAHKQTEYITPKPSLIRSLIPSRLPSAHKGDRGHVVVIGGSKDMPGAPVLSARAALYTGCGKVTIVTPTETSAHLSELPEAMWKFVSSSQSTQYFNTQDYDEIQPILSIATSIVLGPGLGRDPQTRAFAEMVMKESMKRCTNIVLDADALYPEILTDLVEDQTVLTPHPGEAARLLGCSTSEISTDRFKATSDLFSTFCCPTVLKGAGSIIATEGARYINPTGNSAMATAGSGDVLSGVIAALMAQGLSAPDALLAGVYLHGLAGDIAAKKLGETLRASDISEAMSKALETLRSGIHE